ncbi:MAG: MBOAT family protein, partial [Lentisphaerae bacterium]|nr:MBOAT family protein [Lentisphaerota bacterium]
MLFNTYTYAVFLAVVFVLYLALPLRGRQVMLLAASYVFYCWETPIYGTLLLLSTCLDFSCGLIMARLERPRARRLVLAVSIAGNLGLLGFFKYGDFVGANLAGIGRLLGCDVAWTPMGFILPIGISFYTFQTMSYTIQLYRRQIEPCRDFVSFALFVSFFPQLIAGPIERASNLLPQLRVFQRVTLNNLGYGIMRIVFGLFRKLVVADRLAILADRVFAGPELYPTFTVWLGVLAFMGQIYFDFAGYADIAIGSARLFGIRLTENFRRPMLARSMADFWNRWHITLTSWLRDYLFYPLGGARKGAWRAMLNAGIVLGLCGLWHGAAWHFVMWGLFHALMVTLYYLWRGIRKRLWGVRRGPVGVLRLIPAVALVLLVNAVGVVFFRAPDMGVVGRVFRAMLGRHEGAARHNEWFVWVFVVLFVGWWVIEFSQEYLG